MKRKEADTTSYVSKRLKQLQKHHSTDINISDLSSSKVSPPRELPAAPPDSPAPNAERGVQKKLRVTTGVFECVKTKLIVRIRVRTSDAVLWTLETTNAELTHGWANVQPHDDGGEILVAPYYATLTGKYAELNGGILAKNLRSADDKSESLSTRRISEE